MLSGKANPVQKSVQGKVQFELAKIANVSPIPFSELSERWGRC